jgi:hypothetical protein
MTLPQAPLPTRRKFRPFYLALLLPVVVYMALAAGWRWAGLYGLTGDEPRYLLIADSIVRDGDLAIGGDDFAGSAIGADLGVRLEDQRRLHLAPSGYSVHGVALPLLLAVPYRLGGILAVRLALAALSGLLLPLLLYQLARTQLAGERWAVALAVTTALGLPFLVAANQVYPDLPAGLLILFVVSLLLAAPQPPAQRRWIYIGLADGAVALAASALCVAGRSAGGCRHLAMAAQQGARRRARRFGLAVGSAGALAGRPCPFLSACVWEHAGSLHGRRSGVERQYGLDDPGRPPRRQPAGHLSAPPAAFAGAGRSGAAGAPATGGMLLGLALLYCSVVLPNAAHINWYGGESMWGRFHWAVAGLWVLPLAALVARLVKSPAGRRLAGGALGCLALAAITPGHRLGGRPCRALQHAVSPAVEHGRSLPWLSPPVCRRGAVPAAQFQRPGDLWGASAK